MPKNKIISQELGKRKTELCQKWYSLMEKGTEIGIAIAVKRAERMGIDKELEKVEKEYNELVEEFGEPRIFGEEECPNKKIKAKDSSRF